MFSKLLKELKLEDQERISSLVKRIDQKGLLNQDTVDSLKINATSYLDELEYFINLLDKHHCLNQNTLDGLFANYDLRELKEKFCIMSDNALVTPEMLTCLLFTNDTQSFFKFIEYAIQAKVNVDLIGNALTRRIDHDGLSDAITLYNLSTFEYSEQHLPKFFVLTQVLANPLCQTIFAARFRGSSEYSPTVEPLSSNDVDGIIISTTREQDEARIKIFFDCCQKFQTAPLSQKYLCDVDIATIIDDSVKHFCQSKIKKLAMEADRSQIDELIKRANGEKGGKFIFGLIKYNAANTLLIEDLYTQRTYDQIMAEIKNELEKNSANYSNTFVTQLQPARRKEWLKDEGEARKKKESFFFLETGKKECTDNSEVLNSAPSFY